MSSVINETLLAIKSAFDAGVNGSATDKTTEYAA